MQRAFAGCRSALSPAAAFALAALALGVGCEAGPPSADTGAIGGDAGPRPDAGPAPVCATLTTASGEGTFYAGDGTGACSFPPRPDMLFAALNAPQFDGAAYCGACAEVTGPDGTVVVAIVDLCPECASGDLDLSPTAFDVIADPRDGRVPITWREVPCDATGAVTFHVYEGANPWYLAIHVRNHRNRIVALERRLPDRTWAALDRQAYDVWIESPPSGAPIDRAHLRVTDVHGDVVEGDVGAIDPGTDWPAERQLAACVP